MLHNFIHRYALFISILLMSTMMLACSDQMKTPGNLKERQTEANLVQLAGINGCLKCHQPKASLIGPGWDLVAERYRNNPDARAMLIEKVKSGGNGNWSNITGGAIMPPMSPRVSDADIEKLVDYILALK